ncbi:hypothetical protein WME76_11990 [Sorangium sp. So ce119]|uniref:hypothetical protein n=1 Tax=Sorangium sp. So ce119 TaxID=3133279 RepID=UPI003F60A00C
MLPRAIACAAVLLSLVASPTAARASACCGTGHGAAQWLAPSERAAASFSLRLTEQIGAWTAARDFAPSGEGVYRRELRAEAGWMVRVRERFQVGVSVPLIAAWGGSPGGGSSSGGGVGDVSAAGRITMVEDHLSPWIPAAAFTVGASIPVGSLQDAAVDPLGVDATGLGVAEIRPGMLFEKSWGSFQALLAASVSVRTSYRLPTGERIAPGDRAQILVAGGPVWSSGVSLAAGGLYEREGPPREDRHLIGSKVRERTALLAVLAYDISPRWTAVGNLQADLPIAGIGRNEGAFVALSTGLRHVWGRHD